MSRLFNDAATEYLYVNQAVANMPFAMGCWFNSNDLSNYQCLMALVDKDTTNDFYRILMNTSAVNDKLRADSFHTPSSGVATTTTGFSVNTWHHTVAIYASATDRRVFLDGVGKGTNASNVTPVNLDRTSIGIDARSTLFYPMSGMIAEEAIWDLSDWPGATDALKADTFEKILPSLAKAFSPLCFPLGLVAYWPLIRGLNDKVGGYNLTANGTTVSDHPRVILPHGVQ